MWNKPVNIGFGNMVPEGRIVALVGNDSAPVKRMIQDARERGFLVDATQGRRTRAVIVTDSGHIILSAIQPETIAGRMAPADLRLAHSTSQNSSHSENPVRSASFATQNTSPAESPDFIPVREERL